MWLTNDDLILNTPAGNQNLGTAKGFALRSDGNGYVWLKTGDLILNTPTANQDLGMAKGFALDKDGDGFVWLQNDLLYLNTPTQNVDIGQVRDFAYDRDTGRVSAAFILSPVALPADVAGQPYSFASLAAPEPGRQYVYTLVSGRLPRGLSLAVRAS